MRERRGPLCLSHFEERTSASTGRVKVHDEPPGNKLRRGFTYVFPSPLDPAWLTRSGIVPQVFFPAGPLSIQSWTGSCRFLGHVMSRNLPVSVVSRPPWGPSSDPVPGFGRASLELISCPSIAHGPPPSLDARTGGASRRRLMPANTRYGAYTGATWLWNRNMEDLAEGSWSEAWARINVIDRGQEFPEPLKAAQREFCAFPGTPVAPTFPSRRPRCARNLYPPSFLTFLPMAAPEQPVDMGARSDMLEQVRCPQTGRRGSWLTGQF